MSQPSASLALMSRRGWILLLAVGIIWGTPYFLIKIAVAEVSPATVVLARTLIGALVLLPFALRRGGLGVLRGHWPALLGFAALEILGPWFFISNAELDIDSSTAGLLIAAVPLLSVITGRLLGDRLPVAGLRWIGLFIGIGGVALLTGPVAARGHTWAVVQMVLAAIGYAVAPILAERKLREVPAIPLTAACLAIAAIVYAPVVAIEGKLHVPSTGVILALVALGLVCTAFAFVLFFTLIVEVGGARSTLVAYINPLVAVLLGALLLDEPLTWLVAGAAALILTGSALAGRRARPPQTLEEIGRAERDDEPSGSEPSGEVRGG